MLVRIRVAEDFLRHIQTLPWPDRFPDLSPVEHVWDQLKRQISSYHSVLDLELAVQDLWAHLPQDNISHVRIESERRVICNKLHAEWCTAILCQACGTIPIGTFGEARVIGKGCTMLKDHDYLTNNQKGKNAVQARKKLTDVYEEGVLTVRLCQNWFAKFRSGNFDVEDAPRSGRPVEADKDAIKALVDANRRITTHGKTFTSNEELKNHLDQFLASKDQTFYERGIMLLPERWQKVLDKNGQYII
ncbi:histone-lysine N-methyltransferase SETMAR [Trichonephila clavipes]|nr:histone-lysine N-methyltransferase SETMAR [Trichonephila clavipes]